MEQKKAPKRDPKGRVVIYTSLLHRLLISLLKELAWKSPSRLGSSLLKPKLNFGIEYEVRNILNGDRLLNRLANLPANRLTCFPPNHLLVSHITKKSLSDSNRKVEKIKADSSSESSLAEKDESRRASRLTRQRTG